MKNSNKRWQTLFRGECDDDDNDDDENFDDAGGGGGQW